MYHVRATRYDANVSVTWCSTYYDAADTHVIEDVAVHMDGDVGAVDILNAGTVSPWAAAELVRFFRPSAVECHVEEASAAALARAVADSGVRHALVTPDGRDEWTDALLHALAREWTEGCVASEQHYSRGPVFDLVFGDYCLLAGRAATACSAALIPAGRSRAEALALFASGNAEVVESRVRFPKEIARRSFSGCNEFMMPRVRGVLVGSLLDGIRGRWVLWGWRHTNKLRLHVNGEFLEEDRSLEAYGVDDETPVDIVCVR